MNIAHLTSQSLRRVLELTEKKEELIGSIEKLENEIAAIIEDAAQAARLPRPDFLLGTSKGARSHGPHSEVGRRVLALLHEAQGQGMKVREIAERLDLPVKQVTDWLNGLGREVTESIAPGIFTAKPQPAAKKRSAGAVKKPVTKKARPHRKE